MLVILLQEISVQHIDIHYRSMTSIFIVNWEEIDLSVLRVFFFFSLLLLFALFVFSFSFIIETVIKPTHVNRM